MGKFSALQKVKLLNSNNSNTCHDKNVSLSRTGSEDDTKLVKVVARSGGVHHLHSAARQTERQGPERGFASPVKQVVNTCYRILPRTVSLGWESGDQGQCLELNTYQSLCLELCLELNTYQTLRFDWLSCNIWNISNMIY